MCWKCGTMRDGSEDPKKEKFDVYCCPRCGRVEFFVDGIGDELRPH